MRRPFLIFASGEGLASGEDLAKPSPSANEETPYYFSIVMCSYENYALVKYNFLVVIVKVCIQPKSLSHWVERYNIYIKS